MNARVLANIAELRGQGGAASPARARRSGEDRGHRRARSSSRWPRPIPISRPARTSATCTHKLVDTENQIQYARRYYNGAVNLLNNRIQRFPDLLIANTFGFKLAEFFDLEDPAGRQGAGSDAAMRAVAADSDPCCWCSPSWRARRRRWPTSASCPSTKPSRYSLTARSKCARPSACVPKAATSAAASTAISRPPIPPTADGRSSSDSGSCPRRATVIDEPWRTEPRGNGVRVYLGSATVMLRSRRTHLRARLSHRPADGLLRRSRRVVLERHRQRLGFRDRSRHRACDPAVRRFPRASIKLEAYTGAQGAKGRNYTATLENGVPVFTTTRALDDARRAHHRRDVAEGFHHGRRRGVGARRRRPDLEPGLQLLAGRRQRAAPLRAARPSKALLNRDLPKNNLPAFFGAVRTRGAAPLLLLDVDEGRPRSALAHHHSRIRIAEGSVARLDALPACTWVTTTNVSRRPC